MLTIDGRCGCPKCVSRTENIYRMIGYCSNCGLDNILILFRVGDPASVQDCPKCGNYRTVKIQRAATDDEIPEAISAEPVGTQE